MCRENREREKRAGDDGTPLPCFHRHSGAQFFKIFIGIVEGASAAEERQFTVHLTQISRQSFFFSMLKIFSFFTCLSPGPERQPDSFFAAFSLGFYTKTHFHRVRKKTRAYYGLGGKTEKIFKHR